MVVSMDPLGKAPKTVATLTLRLEYMDLTETGKGRYISGLFRRPRQNRIGASGLTANSLRAEATNALQGRSVGSDSWARHAPWPLLNIAIIVVFSRQNMFKSMRGQL